MAKSVNFLDLVYYNRKDGVIVLFDDADALIHYDDDTREWVAINKIRVVKKAEEWHVVDENGKPKKWAKKYLS